MPEQRRFPPPWSDEKASASFEYGPIAFWKMFFRFVDYPILCLNLGFEISDICRKAIRRRSAHTPRAVFALQGPNRKVWIYVAHEPSMRSFDQTANGERAKRDANGQALAYAYFEEEPRRQSAAKQEA